MLIDDFYTLKEIKQEGSIIKATVEFNSAHPIFKGHFPDSPIVPGVCQVQMISEIVGLQLGKSLILESCYQAKFLSFVNPEVNGLLNLQLEIEKQEQDFLLISATYSWKQTIFFKFRGKLNDRSKSV